MSGLEQLGAGFLAAAVRVATPLLLAATGETVTERAGVINLGIEGMMLAGALAAALGASAAGPWTGMLAGIAAGTGLALLFAAVVVGARGDQIITGTAVTLAAVGLTGMIYRQAYGTAGAGLDLPTLAALPIPGLRRIPVIGPVFFEFIQRKKDEGFGEGNAKPALTRAGGLELYRDMGTGPGARNPYFLTEALTTESAWVPRDRNLFGFNGMPFSRTSKCRCGPVVRPVAPTCAIGWPFSTTSPTFTRLLERCA